MTRFTGYMTTSSAGDTSRADRLHLHAGTVTASGQSTETEMGSFGTMRLLLDVTAASGTLPSLTVAVETRHDASDTWRPLGSFAAKTAAGTERKVLAGADRLARVTWAVSGTTPSFTFSVTGEAV